ncbi:MAG: Hydrogenase/urease maturation factor HypB [Candidatus Alkanophagales archaeon MCA70_species_1]|nr:Hydrogenase/urease maturation factor HypB [Candidatus Alkanophaga volatiphilum]
MHPEVVTLEKDILKRNEELASQVHEMLERSGVRAFDIMGSVGSGKTTIIERLVEMLKAEGVRCGAITGDVAGDCDYQRLVRHGVPAKNINTGKQCHLDAHLILHALEDFDLSGIDVLFIENVGNLVCPADFPLGTEKRVVVISVTEGDDIVRKHPLIFQLADIVVLNKIDLAEFVGVEPQRVVEDYFKISPNGRIFLTNAKSGEGLVELKNALLS